MPLRAALASLRHPAAALRLKRGIVSCALILAAACTGSSPRKAAVPVQLPAPPSIVTTQPGDNSVAVNATHPAYSGALTGLRIYYATAPGVTASSPHVDIAGDPGWATLPLPGGNGTTYTIALSAVGDWGETSLSPEVAVTPHAPTSLGLRAFPGDMGVALSWNPVSGAFSYDISGGGGGQTGSTNWHSGLLTNGQPYTFTVQARAADSKTVLAQGTATVTPEPAPPSIVTTQPGDNSVAVNATHPAYSGTLTALRIYYATVPGVTASSPHVDIAGDPSWATLPLPGGNGTTYAIALSAVGDWGETSLSPEVAVTPHAPTSLYLRAFPGDMGVALSWNPVSGAFSYDISGGGGGQTGSTNWRSGFLTNGQPYTFTVQARAADSKTVLAQGAVTVTPEPAPPSIVTTQPGDNSVAVNATHPAYSGALTGLRIYYATAPGVTASSPHVDIAGDPSWATLPLPGGNGTTYAIALSAVGDWGETSLSPEVAVTPHAPTSLGLRAFPGDRGVALTWNPVSGAFSYDISGGGGGQTGSTNWHSGFLTNGQPYTFTVQARASDSKTILAQGTATVTPYPGAAQLSVSGYPSPTTTGVAHAFTVTAQGSSGSLAGGYAGTVHFTSSDPTAVLPADYAFTTTDQGTHTFSATFNTPGPQALTATDTVAGTITGTQGTVTVVPPLPSAPTNLAASPGSGSGQIALTWDAVPSATTYNIYYATTADTGTSGTKVTVGTTSRLVTGLLDGTPYYFVVTAVNAGGESPVSNQTSATPATPVATHFAVAAYPSPTGSGTAHTFTVTALSASSGTVAVYAGTVHFTSTDGAAVLPPDYTFVPGDNGVHAFSATLATVGTQVLTATDTANASITGSQTGITVTPPPPAAPTGVAVSAGDGRSTVSWSAVTGATSYNLYASTTSGTGLGGTRLAGATSPQVVTGLANGTAYFFVVTALGPGGESVVSSEVSATPAHAPSTWSATTQVKAASGSSIITLDLASAPDGGTAVGWVELKTGSPAVYTRKVQRYDLSALQWLAAEQPGADPSTVSSIFGHRLAAANLGRVGVAAAIFDGSIVTNLLSRYDHSFDNAATAAWSGLDALAPTTANGQVLAATFSQDGGLLGAVFNQRDPVTGNTQYWANTYRYAACRYTNPPGTCPVNPPDFGLRTPNLLEANLQGSSSLMLNSLGAASLMVAYQNQDPANGNRSTLFFSTFDGTLGVESWSPRARIVPSALPNAYLATHAQLLATNASGQAVLTYGEPNGSLNLVAYAAGGWLSPQRVDYEPEPGIILTGNFGQLPPISAGIDAAGVISVAWVQQPNSTSSATLHLARTGSGGALGAPVQVPLPDDFTPQLPTVLSAANGDVLVVFRSSGYPPPTFQSTYRIYALRYSAASGAWDPTPTLLASASSLQVPKASIDSQGRATVIWQDATQTSIYIVRFE